MKHFILFFFLFHFFIFPTEILRAAGPSEAYTFKELIKMSRDSVVNIRSEEVAKNGTSPLKDYFRLGKHLKPEFKVGSLGTGFIVSSSGLVLTNYHVIAPPPRYLEVKEVRVRFSDHREMHARIIGRDKKTDIALLQIEGEETFTSVRLGDSSKIDIGAFVMAIGNAFGIEASITVGVVSAKGRVLGAGPYDHYIQTDAVIHSGNTGGPLYNIRGEVIGMNTTVSVTGYGIGFAIPINMIKNMVPMLQKDGRVTRGWLGVVIHSLTRELAKAFNLKNNKGALISEVMPDSPAEKAGLLRGDVIVQYEGREIHKMPDLPSFVASTPVGTTVSVDLIREGERLQLEVTVQLME